MPPAIAPRKARIQRTPPPPTPRPATTIPRPAPRRPKARAPRINTAADDAAGVAIASRLTAEIRGTNQAIRNAADAQALIDTAEGAHDEVVNLLQRMRELAVQAANDTNASSDRTALGLEMTALTAEIDRIANVTSWAGIKLLDGPLANVNAAQTTQTGNASFEFHIGSGNSAADEMIVTIGAMGSTALGIAGSAILPQSLTDLTTATNGAVLTTSQAGGTLTFASGTAVVGDAYSVKINGTTVNMAVAADQYALDEKGVAAKMKAAIEAAGIAGINVADNGSGVLTLSVGNSLSVTTATNAQATIGTIDSAINTVNAQRAQLGSWSNRLDSTISNLTNISTNLEAGRGRIEDADFAAETTNLAKSQILQQASMAMLAQANASKQGVLSLLQR